MTDRGYIPREIRRHQGDAIALEIDNVAEEVPVALVYNGISHAVMMATPLDLEAFATGFSLTEGIVDSVREIFDVEVAPGCDGIEVRLEISQRAFMAMKERRRTLAGRTGCGVCGIESLALLDLVPEPLTAARPIDPTAPMIRRAAEAMRARQPLMAATGGVHAAAWCGPDGQLRAVFEDVGRHNALDKLIGHLARAREAFGEGFVFLSSRASYELVRKAARMQIPMLATISAPTSLAIRVAEQAGVRLLSFCRQDGFVEYTAPVSVLASDPLVAAG
ncbi:formate dehydrogenase accessory sulfurtransferase FdhD [Cupriavidus pauculus]|uniref:formate dehydrogenase accessory sulfurtransferase FdhD n=1 Tax=Cupriavidus pauculus TaxID=82633 RepID=UPI001EE329A4|nr:formate dehydrogenase accessory sulfurtransferase FdhD [Cupriavidus pauculus]GJG93047.1 formate dehydrogenase accessory sulfurtransferase FdhD [Cupriavidus pauculus]